MNKSVSVVLSLSFCAFIFLNACTGHAVKEKLNSAGEKAGEAVGEVVHGVSSGVANAFDVSINLSDNLKNNGIQLGKIQIGNDKEGTDNLLSVYIIFNKEFNGTVSIKVFDHSGLEMGRDSEKIEGKPNEARFIDFHFDKRTNIDRDSKITME